MKYNCSKCTKELSSKQNLKKHEDKCNGLKTKQCELCHKEFSDKKSKYTHKKNKVCERNGTMVTIECSKCSKKLSSKQNLQKHELKCNLNFKIPKDNLQWEINDNNKDTIYLLHEREFKKLKEPIYKIGKTTRFKNRMKKYPKNSDIFLNIKVLDCNKIENMLLQEFPKIFKPRKDIGKEYFEGNVYQMINLIMTIILQNPNL
jgi:hypothetical protein